jgi:hypothetical protein
MRKLLFAIVCMLLCSGSILRAQNIQLQSNRDEANGRIKKDPNDTTKLPWKKGLTFNLNLNQGSLTNWAAGGDKYSFSVASTLNAFAFYRKGKNTWDNVIDLAYGYVNTTSLGGRKADDRLVVTTKYGYEVAKNLYLSGLLDLRTQFSAGYLYSDTAKPQRVSGFFAPAYVLGSPGLDYKPTDQLSVFFSPVTARYVIVKDDFLAAQGAFGVDSGHHVQSQFGAYLTVNWTEQIVKNIVYKTRLDLFSDYKHNPQDVDVFWTNSLNLQVNKYIAANISLNMIYDDDVRVFANPKTGVLGPRLQVQEVIGVGFIAKF